MTETNNIIPMTETNNIIPIKRSYTKKEKYQKEQEEIVKRLNDILGLNEKNNKFVLEELKQDQDKQNKILALAEDVKKYFAYNRWAYFKVGVNNEYISLMRSIYKSMDYEVSYKQKQKNGEKYTEYYIHRNTLG